MPTFTVFRDGDVIEDTVFDVDPLMDTANPFGDFCVVKMDDRGGNKFAEYGRGTRVDISVDPEDNTLSISSGETVTSDAGTTDNYSTVNNAGTYSNQGTVTAGAGTIDERFTGYVVERRETEQSGADVLEVEAYSFDQFLRRNTVTNDQTGNTISEALADIIQTDTPVTYVAGNVNVGDDQELTRTYQGESVENVLRDLAFKSNNENFGVNDDLEFFFRLRETAHIDRGIDNTQWFQYDIPELGKEAINEVEVWFDDGERSVIIDDGTDKLDLQDSLGLPSPGTQRAELNRPLITNINDAEDIGRKYLSFRNATLSGTVTTYGLFDAEPGDTIDITIDPRGIDAEFVIAATEYRWGVDQTILTIVEKRGDVDDILSELNDSVQRQEMETANRDAPKNRITTTNATAIVSITADGNIANTNVVTVASGETLSINSGETETATTVSNAGTVSNQGTFSTTDGPDQDTMSDRLVNDGRRKIRDTWTGDSPPDITTLVVGNDNSGLSRSNTSLVNQTDSVSVTQSLPDSKTVVYTASIVENGVQEIGLETADGTLITRATFDQSVDLDGEVMVALTVSNDDSVSRGVLTNNGQTAVRNVLADNTPALPDAYAYGSDDTAVAESDTALGNELVTVSLDEILIQQADTETEWNSIWPDIADTEPVEIDATGPKVLQTCFTTEGEDSDAENTNTTRTNGVYSDGIAASMGTNGQFREWNFTLDYALEPANFEIAIRWASGGGSLVSADLEWSVDGDLVSRYSPGESTADDPDWETEIIATDTVGGGLDSTLEPGSHTLRAEVVEEETDSFIIDVVAPYDTRYNYTFDNDNGGSGGYLDGPQFFPDVVTTSLATADTRRNVTTANFSLTANDVSNNFFVELANDGSTFTTFNNATSGSVTFASPERGVDTNIGLSRYGTQNATPQTGINGQQLDSWSLFANPDAVLTEDIGEVLTRAVISPGTLTGSTVQEAGIKGDGQLLTRHILAAFSPLQGQRVSSSETTLFTSDN